MIYNKTSKNPVFAVEVNEFHYNKDGTKQAQRDRMKDSIFALYSIPLLRFPTTGSGEKDKIEQILIKYKNSR